MKTLMDRSSSLKVRTAESLHQLLDIGAHEKDAHSTQGYQPGGVRINSRARRHGRGVHLAGSYRTIGLPFTG
jgi:hypothetical protein